MNKGYEYLEKLLNKIKPNAIEKRISYILLLFYWLLDREKLREFMCSFLESYKRDRKNIYKLLFDLSWIMGPVIAWEWKRYVSLHMVSGQKKKGSVLTPLTHFTSYIESDFPGLKEIAESARERLRDPSPRMRQICMKTLYNISQTRWKKYSEYLKAVEEVLQESGESRPYYMKEVKPLSQAEIYCLILLLPGLSMSVFCMFIYMDTLISFPHIMAFFLSALGVAAMVHTYIYYKLPAQKSSLSQITSNAKVTALSSIMLSPLSKMVSNVIVLASLWGCIITFIFLLLNLLFPQDIIKTESFRIMERGKYSGKGGIPYAVIHISEGEKELRFPKKDLSDYSFVELELQKGLFGYDIVREKKLLKK